MKDKILGEINGIYFTPNVPHFNVEIGLEMLAKTK